HTDRVTGCAIAPDGTWLATTSNDGTARIWNPQTGTINYTLRGHTDRVTGCAIAPDGTWLATTGWDGSVRVWDPVGGVAAAAVRVNAMTYVCTWLPDSEKLLIGGDAGVYLFLYESQSQGHGSTNSRHW
ncbi:WD40 repeat domain-containing protein, partial [Micromonospora sp. NPDC003241]